MNIQRLLRVLLLGAAAVLLAAPVSQAATGKLVQIDGKLVAPAQLSEAQLAAGHDPSTRLVQIGGRLIEPSKASAWQSRAGQSAKSTVRAEGGSSSDFGTGAIAASAALGFLLVLAASTVIVRHRRRLVPA
jgi:hypothetical protein